MVDFRIGGTVTTYLALFSVISLAGPLPKGLTGEFICKKRLSIPSSPIGGGIDDLTIQISKGLVTGLSWQTMSPLGGECDLQFDDGPFSQNIFVHKTHSKRDDVLIDKADGSNCAVLFHREGNALTISVAPETTCQNYCGSSGYFSTWKINLATKACTLILENGNEVR